ncbi:type IV secretion system protein [Sphingobium sp. BYY-5]|uniref:type IV secretion system protein n=1 Tax=Sphingobium sp. BYY-5 TaxID=2926400 RepID=UPI001FA754FC|nr:type IV secretion system protein [Sphingobium sp. BYY-5]MCI4590396.1 type IV secretion system protein [Sphingobium sp. BYY-5]MCI4591488.1 type IV secretion system protein [Sphingobium sp. BYY-5]
MEGCAPFDAAQGYAMALTRYVDCQAALLGEGGYAALSAGNSPVILGLGGLLTILIAFQGYRLLLGDQLQIRDGILLVAKIGLVLAFATQWSAYRSVVYNLAIEAPREVLALLPGAGGGTGRSFPARLQGSYQSIAELTRPSTAVPPVNPSPSPDGAPAAPPPPQAPLLSLAGNPLLTVAGILLLVSGLAVLMSVRLIAGLLLALGPLFFACLLFDTTRGLFEGWVRALIGTAVASVATGVLLGIEMAIIEPQLAALIQAMMAGTLPVLAPGEILATIVIFTLALLIALFVSLRMGAGFRFVERGLALGSSISERWRSAAPVQQGQERPSGAAQPQEEGRSRAAMISDSIRISDQWETRPLLTVTGPDATRRIALSERNSPGDPRPTPLGQSYRRTGHQRKTKSISQRNGRI